VASAEDYKVVVMRSTPFSTLDVLEMLVFLGWCLLILGSARGPDRGLDFPAFYTAASVPVKHLYDAGF